MIFVFSFYSEKFGRWRLCVEPFVQESIQRRWIQIWSDYYHLK